MMAATLLACGLWVYGAAAFGLGLGVFLMGLRYARTLRPEGDPEVLRRALGVLRRLEREQDVRADLQADADREYRYRRVARTAGEADEAIEHLLREVEW